MCGRYSFHLTAEELSELTGSVPDPLPPAVYNQSPGRAVPVLGSEDGWDCMPWGKEMVVAPSRRRLVINARSETAGEKSAFKEAFENRRCVVPVSGFFEWRRRPGYSQPFYFHPRSGPGILLAGICLDDGSMVVLTKSADDWMGEVHHRAPVLIRPDRLDSWFFRGHSGREALSESAFPAEEPHLKRHAVSDRVSRVSENDAKLLEEVPVEPEAIQEELF